MLRLSEVIRKSLRRNGTAVRLFSSFAFGLFAIAPLSAQVVATYDFEDGTAQGWTSFNGATNPASSTAAAYSGSHTLLTTTGPSGQGGPSIDVGTVLQAGAKYTITQLAVHLITNQYRISFAPLFAEELENARPTSNDPALVDDDGQ